MMITTGVIDGNGMIETNIVNDMKVTMRRGTLNQHEDVQDQHMIEKEITRLRKSQETARIDFQIRIVRKVLISHLLKRHQI